MESKEIAVVRAFVAAINAGDVDRLCDLMTEDHTFIDSGGTREQGRENMKVGWKQYFEMFPDFKLKIDRFLNDGNLVAAFGSASGTYNGKRGLVPENMIEMPAAWKAIVEGDKVKHWQVYTDWTNGTRIIEEDEAST